MRIIKKRVPAAIVSIHILRLAASGSGINSTISISNTKKITASKKNRRENGMRAVFLGSKPHSKGDFFSRSIVDRADRMLIKAIKIIGRSRATTVE